MKKLLTVAALLAATSLCLQGVSFGHGGTYRGPGDTVPPGGGGGGGGGGPAAPGPAGPSSPGSAPGPSGPLTPSSPGAAPAGASARAAVTQGAVVGGADLTLWQFWWGFNKEPYLNLKAAIHHGSVVTGSDDFFLGEGEKSQARDSLKPSEEVIRSKIVPALLASLGKERSNDIITGCLIALAKIGDARGEGGESGFEPQIKKFLSDSNQEISETAAVSLGILANEESVATLVELLANTSEGKKLVGRSNEVPQRTRAFAAYGLGLIGNRTADEAVRKEVVVALAAMLSGEAKNLSLRDVPVACVTAMGLVPLSFDPEYVVPEEGGPVADACLQSQIAWLTEYYESDINFLVRAHVPTALVRLLTDQEVDGGNELKTQVAATLLPAIGKHSKAQLEIQQSCVIALGLLADADADKTDADIREALSKVTDNITDIQARHFSMIALAHAGGKPGHGEGDRLVGATELRKVLLRQLSRGKTSVKRWAGIGLGVMERRLADNGETVNSDAAQALRSALADSKSTTDVGAYSIGVGIMSDPEAKTILLKKLDTTRDVDTRGFVAVALGLLDAREAIEPIQEVVKTSKYRPELLRSAAIGLGLLGDKQLVPELIDMLSEARGLSAQASISQALGFIGDARSIDPLITMLDDESKTDLARGFAAVALGIVADKEPLPWNSKISVDINYRANTQTLTDHAQGTGILDIL